MRRSENTLAHLFEIGVPFQRVFGLASLCARSRVRRAVRVRQAVTLGLGARVLLTGVKRWMRGMGDEGGDGEMRGMGMGMQMGMRVGMWKMVGWGKGWREGRELKRDGLAKPPRSPSPPIRSLTL